MTPALPTKCAIPRRRTAAPLDRPDLMGAMGPLGQAPIRSLRPTGGCLGGLRRLADRSRARHVAGKKSGQTNRRRRTHRIIAVRSFSTTSSGDLRAAASGRPRPPKTRRREPASTRPGLHRPRAPRAAPWKPTPRCGPADSAGRSEIAHGSSAVEGPQKVRAAYAIPYSYLDELFFA
jgi:hypothetical protein